MITASAIKRAASITLVLGVTLVPTGSGVSAGGGLPATTVRGVNFEIRSQNDQNFCIEAGAGGTEGRTLTMQGCSTVEAQRWALPWYSTGVNQLVDSQGLCLTVRGVRVDQGESAILDGCQADRTEFLTYTSSGLLMFAKGCLAISGTAANAPVVLATCDATKPTQRWVVTHPSA